jgi:hypothetical protein
MSSQRNCEKNTKLVQDIQQVLSDFRLNNVDFADDRKQILERSFEAKDQIETLQIDYIREFLPKGIDLYKVDLNMTANSEEVYKGLNDSKISLTTKAAEYFVEDLKAWQRKRIGPDKFYAVSVLVDSIIGDGAHYPLGFISSNAYSLGFRMCPNETIFSLAPQILAKDTEANFLIPSEEVPLFAEKGFSFFKDHLGRMNVDLINVRDVTCDVGTGQRLLLSLPEKFSDRIKLAKALQAKANS